jgi:hypothetical protein
MTNKTGDFDVLKLTNAGRDMLTQARAGQTLTFTKVVIGDGTATGAQIDSLVDIKSPKLTLPISKNETVHAGQMRLQFRVNNSQVNTSFYLREIGLMAKVNNGPEKLYAYTTCGDKAKMVYDKTYPVQEKIINIDTVTDNAVNVKVILDLSIMYATRKDIDTAIIPHKELAELDHPDESVTTRKLRDKSVTLPKLADDVTELLQKTYVKKVGDTMTGDLTFDNNSVIKINRKAGGGFHIIGDGGVDDGQTNLDIGSIGYTKQANLCCYQRPGWYGKNKAREFHAFALLDDISITSGNINDGETLPIPEGFTEGECNWLLSIDQSNKDQWYLDIREGGACNMINVECWREGRRVHVGTRFRGQDGLSKSYNGWAEKGRDAAEAWIPGRASYICIAVKRG